MPVKRNVPAKRNAARRVAKKRTVLQAPPNPGPKKPPMPTPGDIPPKAVPKKPAKR